MNSKFIETFPTILTCTQCNGVDYSPTSPSPCMTLSMPNYIPAIRHSVSSLSFGVWVGVIPFHLHPTCTLLRPLISHHLSTLVSPAEKTWIQQVVGSLLFYARARDLSILTAVCQLSSHQSNPTQHDLASAHLLLSYVSSLFHGPLGLYRRQLPVPT
jgi:hypothetical protein